MQDAVSVSFKTCSKWIIAFRNGAITWANGASGKWCHGGVFSCLSGGAVGDVCSANAGP
jgi:hypothetical protein